MYTHKSSTNIEDSMIIMRQQHIAKGRIIHLSFWIFSMLKEPKYYKMSNIKFATLMKTYKWVELGHDTRKKERLGDILLTNM